MKYNENVWDCENIQVLRNERKLFLSLSFFCFARNAVVFCIIIFSGLSNFALNFACFAQTFENTHMFLWIHAYLHIVHISWQYHITQSNTDINEKLRARRVEKSLYSAQKVRLRFFSRKTYHYNLLSIHSLIY